MNAQSFNAYITRLKSLTEVAKIASSPTATYDDTQPPWSTINVFFWVDGLFRKSCKDKGIVGDSERDARFTSEWIGVGECV